ncbi:uncharacterized protein LOC143068952 [Mytilus galloprovincialis]|uniref:uncharacterized protein LOC143068952 n=1 Tax=Mytilus galloprovincialis TaxID=29158 RepID=UPI003F7BA980
MMDEGGGLHSALETKYEAIYCQDKVVTCQLHLNMCRNRHTSSVFIGNDDKEQKIVELRKKINDMVHSTTVNQYNSQYNEVKRFITENNKSSLLKWLQCWDKRRNHVMDAYRDVSAPNTNLAEVSHASTTHCGGSNLNLIQTAVFDISDCFKYAQSVKGYFSGVVKGGSGPSYQRKQMILEQRADNRAESLLHELDGQFKGGKAPQLPKNSTFMAEPSASDREDKSSDKDKRPIGKTRTNNSKEFNLRIEKARAMGDYRCIEVNIHSPMQATVSLVSPEGETYSVYFDQKATCSCPFSKLQSTEKLRKVACKHRLFILICLDPCELAYLHGIISKCYGCDKKYTDINRKTPFDVIIKHLEVRPRFNKDKKEWYISANKEKSNAYYHLQTDCVQTVHPNFKAGDIIITNELRQTLSEEHRHYLTNLGIEL